MHSTYIKLGRVIILVTLSVLCSIANAKTTTANGGDWFSAGNWDNGVPACGDLVIIPAGITITLDANNPQSDVLLDEPNGCFSPTTIRIYGTIAYLNNGGNIYLADGSGVAVYPGGILGKDGSGNAERLFIGGVAVFNADDGAATGPITFGSASLPVELIYFKGQCENSKVSLEWATASEKNNNYFELQKSIDGENFNVIAKIMGNGTTQILNKYDYTDIPTYSNGILFYKLRQVDYDGKFESFDIIAIETSNLTNQLVQVFPNPSTQSILNINSEIKFTTVEINNLMGKRISNISGELLENGINIENLPSGGYLIRFNFPSGSIVKRFVVDR
ncbi:MAG: T9SS type A sorting domain-containing protein [Cyclobacteriaceae bacterium]